MDDEILIDVIIKKLNAIHNLVLERKKPFLNLEEASNYLRIPKGTLYKYTCKKVLPHHKIQGRKVYFSIDDLNDFILNKKNRISSRKEIEIDAVTSLVTGKIKRF